jgi:hypothetical protein
MNICPWMSSSISTQSKSTSNIIIDPQPDENPLSRRPDSPGYPFHLISLYKLIEPVGALAETEGWDHGRAVGITNHAIRLMNYMRNMMR